jgi:class 3 adenylate cyclase/GTPase SAR1 family protein
VYCLALDEAGARVIAGCDTGQLALWDTATGALIHTFIGHQQAVNGIWSDFATSSLTSAGDDAVIRTWSIDSGDLVGTFRTAHGRVLALAGDGRILATGHRDGSLELWNMLSGTLLRAINAHAKDTLAVALHPGAELVATGSSDQTVKLWDVTTGQLRRTLEGHTKAVESVTFSADGLLLASKGNDDVIRIWNTDSWTLAAVIPAASVSWIPAFAFHPSKPMLASTGSHPGSLPGQLCRLVQLWRLAPSVQSGDNDAATVHYVNAKVVLLGDTGVGKSGLSMVLNGKPFEATDSTPGRHVWTLDTRELVLDKRRRQTRETLLWDLAGQPGYRIIHQLHLKEVAVALVVFDARSETEPLAGVRHWERALRLAHERHEFSAIPMTKYLVSARVDRGGVSVSRERIQSVRAEFGFHGYFETSAKEGWQIAELRAAIENAIPWDDLPIVTSEELFVGIKRFLLTVKESGRLLAAAADLYHAFQVAGTSRPSDELRAQFNTCVGRLENRDLIRRLTFGDYILLQPELLDAYGSAMVNAAKNEPDGFGSITENAALTGAFHIPDEQKVVDRGQEQLLLYATVEELMRHDLALRETTDDGRYIVFPSQFNRDYEDAPEPKGTALAVTFEGPVQSVYSTLAVRLAHSGLFHTARTEMWRNAAVFTARSGGKCGVYVREFVEARGQALLFFDPDVSVETRFHFEEYVSAHIQRRSIDGLVTVTRFFICDGCGTPVPDAYVQMRRSHGSQHFDCPCGTVVSLAEPMERLTQRFASQIAAMDRSADRRRDFEAFILSARGETRTKSFLEWAGGERVTLAIAFTDIVGSTALEESIGGESMIDLRRNHFAQARQLLEQHRGREIKTIGDSVMAAFRGVEDALDFARALKGSPGVPGLKLRAGIHVGPMYVEGNDVFGGAVNLAARVVGSISGAEIWLTDRAKDDLESLRAKRHRNLEWRHRDNIALKGFANTFTLWSLIGIRDHP